MDKKTLEKIYLLRKIRPEKTWVFAMKESIPAEITPAVQAESRKVSVWEYFALPVVQNRLTLAGAFAFLFFFGYLVFPLLPSNYDYVAYIPAFVVEEKENLNMIPEDGEESIEMAKRKQPIEKEFAVLKEGLYAVQRQVLGTMIEEEEKIEIETWTDKDIVDYYIAKIEGERDDTVQVMMMGVQEEDERLEMLKEAHEKEDYGEAFNLIVDILSK